MTTKVKNGEFRSIPWADVRKGDVLMHENGDRNTVTGVEDEAGIPIVNWFVDTPARRITIGQWNYHGFSPYRKQPELPAEPGAYLDKDGDYWLLDQYGNWYDWSSLGAPDPWDGNPEDCAPFTRLVPLPTEERVYESIERAAGDQFIGAVHPATTAVMALLAGETDG